MGTRLTVSARVAAMLVRFGEAAGASREEMCQKAAIPPEALGDLDARVPVESVSRLWWIVSERTKDPFFGLRLAAAAPLGALDVVDYVFRNAPTLGESMERLMRYQRVIFDGARLSLERLGAVARYTHRVVPVDPLPPHHLSEFFIAIFVARTRSFVGDAFAPRAVGFSHAAPLDASMHRAYFRCEPTFDQATSWAEFDATLLDAPVAGADPALAAMLERHARDLVAGLPTTSVADQVRALLAKDLAGGVPEASGAAKKLGLSERSLHRKLRDERHSYQAIVDGVRRHLAERHLAERRLPITEIAFLLGFTEASSFHRAFRRWTGRTPAAYRDALGA